MNTDHLNHIDALRAIAVLLVVFHHLGIFFSGGFIGVDIFFVISGYLITKNISKSIAQNSFSLKNFYARRIKRLAPAFFTVLGISLIMFTPILLMEEKNQFLHSIISAVTLSSNIHFFSTLNDYFGINASSTPLLHIWSLSLEEQYYIIFPLFLILITKNKINIKSNIIITAITLILLLILSHCIATTNKTAAYYLLPARAFEFLFGTLIALIPKTNKKNEIKNIITTLSIILIMILGINFDDQTFFPSYNAAIICLLTSLVIYFGNSCIIEKLKILNYIGRISYPLYLWHWPVITYLSINSVQKNTLNQIILFLFLFAISSITHEKIEKRFINIKANDSLIIKKLFLLPSLITIFICLSLIKINKYKEETKENNNEQHLAIKCIDSFKHPIDSCYMGNLAKSNIDFLLIGDSHANAQGELINILAKDANIKGYQVTYSSTIFLPNFEKATKRSSEIEHHPDFSQKNNLMLKKIIELKPKYVIMGGFFPHNHERNIYFKVNSQDFNHSKKYFIEGLNNAIKFIKNNGAIPILINDNPILVNIDINCNLRTNKPIENCHFPSNLHQIDFKEWKTTLNQLKKKNDKLIIIDFNSLICNTQSCYSYIGSTPLYRDNQHLSYSGSKELGIAYLQRFTNPLLEDTKYE